MRKTIQIDEKISEVKLRYNPIIITVNKFDEDAARKFRDNYKAEVRDSAKVKKMGGGMMQRPMGYKSGTMVKARGCKLGRTRPTKIT